MEERTALYRSLTVEARELYDYVNDRHPAPEDSSGPFGTERRGSSRDDAFRNLLKSVLEETPEPRNWVSGAWPDSLVTRAASNPEVRRRAWASLASDDPAGWKFQWAKRHREDRRGFWVILAVGAVFSAIVVFTEGVLVLNIFFAVLTMLIIGYLIVRARRLIAEQKNTTSGP